MYYGTKCSSKIGPTEFMRRKCNKKDECTIKIDIDDFIHSKIESFCPNNLKQQFISSIVFYCVVSRI